MAGAGGGGRAAATANDGAAASACPGQPPQRSCRRPGRRSVGGRGYGRRSGGSGRGRWRRWRIRPEEVAAAVAQLEDLQVASANGWERGGGGVRQRSRCWRRRRSAREEVAAQQPRAAAALACPGLTPRMPRPEEGWRRRIRPGGWRRWRIRPEEAVLAADPAGGGGGGGGPCWRSWKRCRRTTGEEEVEEATAAALAGEGRRSNGEGPPRRWESAAQEQTAPREPWM